MLVCFDRLAFDDILPWSHCSMGYHQLACTMGEHIFIINCTFYLDLHSIFSTINPWNCLKWSWGEHINQIEFFCKVGRCYYLRRANIHKPWQIKLLHNSICPLLGHDIFYSQSFMEQHSMEIHKQFSTFHLFCRYYSAQNPQFSNNFSNRLTNSRVWDLYAQYSIDEGRQLHW